MNVHGKCFSLKARITEVFKADRIKLFASNKKQIDNHTLMLDMLHSNMSVVCTILEMSVKRFFGVAVVLCYLCSQLKKLYEGNELQFLCTQGTLQGGRVEEWCSSIKNDGP